MATREEVVERIASRLREVRQEEVTWADIVSSVAATSAAEKNRIIEAVKRGVPLEIGAIILRLVQTKVTNEALAEATAMIADDTLTITELQRIF